MVATKVLAVKVPCGVVDMKIFLAGATGAIGRRLVPLLLGFGKFRHGRELAPPPQQGIVRPNRDTLSISMPDR